ncbi:unnamed protein product [Commensalibacter papalotli (ex Botero et al. 2024)]|uniref:Uncharacterized protein n=2 Tax=Commensalibacter papalotli (ex Botero et al. 2024) TaxID=2972766 RepID=A0ABM9HRT4_9PROT|nr:unnamed protein product [Commensalibacter papalotli (ex Botero et al. 2024)]
MTLCFQKAFGSRDPILNEDAKATMGFFLELWMDYNFGQPNKIQGKLDKLIENYLKQTYRLQMHPKSKLYIFNCMDLYHSYDLDRLTKEFVAHSNQTCKQDHPKYPHEW